jgi:nitrogen fixation protein FixH
MTLPRRWMFVPIGLLSLNALVMVVLVTASSWHPPEVVPQYYERAVAWDQAVAAAQAAEDLGWKIDVALDHGGASVRAHDGAGRPVARAHVTLTGFHRGYPDRRAQLDLTTDAVGDARGVPRDGVNAWRATPGWYEVEIAIKRGAISYSVHRSLRLDDPVAEGTPL